MVKKTMPSSAAVRTSHIFSSTTAKQFTGGWHSISRCKKTKGNGKDAVTRESKLAVRQRDQRGRGPGTQDQGEGRCRQRHVIWAPGGVEVEAAAPETPHSVRGPSAHSLHFPKPKADKRWGLAGRRRGTGKTRGRRRAARHRSKAAGGHFTSGAAQGPSGPPRPQPSVVSPPPPPPPGGRSPTPARLAEYNWAGKDGCGEGAGLATGPGLRAVRRGRGRLRPRAVASAGYRPRGAEGEERERAGSRYLYWAAAAAAAAPLWVNPK